MRRGRAGFSLVELIVAMVLLSITLVALVSTATLAASAFTDAAASESSARAAAQVVDSLVRVPSPTSGTRAIGSIDVAWTVGGDGGILTIDLSTVHRGSGDTLLFHTARLNGAEP